MRRSSVLSLFTVLALLVAEQSIEASVVVAGSSATAPPAFQSGPHFQVTTVIDRAHPFTIDADGPYRVDQLQIAAYRVANREPVIAQFVIHADDYGVPSPSPTTFSLSEIPLDVPSIPEPSTSMMILMAALLVPQHGARRHGMVRPLSLRKNLHG
jgi:hypothetical protein